jgi:hypothetical protein
MSEALYPPTDINFIISFPKSGRIVFDRLIVAQSNHHECVQALRPPTICYKSPYEYLGHLTLGPDCSSFQLIKPLKCHFSHTRREHSAHQLVIITPQGHPLLIMAYVSNRICPTIVNLEPRGRESLW